MSPEYDKVGLEDIYGGQSGETDDTFSRRSRRDPRSNVTLERMLPWYDVRAEGATGDGSTDDTAAIRRSITAAENNGGVVYLPEGVYRVTDALTLSGTQVVFAGDGMETTIIDVTTSFNLNALGVIVFASGEPAPVVRDLQIRFTQPDTATKGALTVYPPAIYAVAQPRFRVLRTKIVRAYDGIDMTGNSGGALIEDLQMSMFNIGIDIDGSLDSVRINNIHIWPFGLSANQDDIFYEETTYGIQSGRMDDLHLNGGLFLCGTQLRLIRTASGTTFGNVTNTGFDTYSGLVMQAGRLDIAGSHFTVGGTDYQAIEQTGGWLTITGCYFTANAALTDPLVDLSGSDNARLIIGQSLFNTGSQNINLVYAITGGNRVVLVGNEFIRAVDTVYTAATVNIAAGARLTAVGNRTSDKGTGTGDFFEVAEDNHHIIADNTFLDWTINIPGGVLYTTHIHDNASLGDGDYENNQLIGRRHIMRFTGTADGAGVATFAHSLTKAHHRVLMVQGFYEGASNEMIPMTVAYVDGTDIKLTGATASATYRAAIVWAPTVHDWGG